MDQWKKCQSKSRPGKYYFFNVVTKKSSWKLPSTMTPVSFILQGEVVVKLLFPILYATRFVSVLHAAMLLVVMCF